jgi:O-acetyl-ADP-ribose deacetylase (regulator of RNase III)
MSGEVIGVRFEYAGKTVEVMREDITRVDADAIVNAANQALRGGGGVDGAIHGAGGPSIMEECRKIGHCSTGSAVITTAGQLPARHVIHTVGPVWQDGESGEPELLRSAYENSLQLAADHKLASIAFPSISTGAYGYPISRASRIAIRTVLDFLKQDAGVSRVIFVLFSESDYRTYLAVIKQMIGEQA